MHIHTVHPAHARPRAALISPHRTHERTYIMASDPNHQLTGDVLAGAIIKLLADKLDDELAKLAGMRDVHGRAKLYAMRTLIVLHADLKVKAHALGTTANSRHSVR